MTMQEVIENELKCVQRDCCRLENECAKCDLVLPKEEIINAYNKALKLEKENEELKEQNIKFQKILTEDFIKDVSVSMEYADKLEQAKELIRQLCLMVRELNNPNVQLTNEAEQFLKECE